jgi:diguanylate cyclase (GGDEF)-like protein
MAFTYRSSVLDLVGFRQTVDTLDPDLPVAVAVIDVDGFGPLNEEQGHEAGDRVLAGVEAALVAGAPDGAVIGHVKGDEWVIALADALPEDLLIAVDGIRRTVLEKGPLPITGGVAGRPQHGATVDELLAAADTGLVRAKQSGRNKVAIATDERMVLKSNYYTRPALHRLAKLAARTGHTEAHHLRQALDDHLARHAELL